MTRQRDNSHDPATPVTATGANSDREHLVTIEAQREFDLFTGIWAERIFVKLYVAARTSGLLAAISDRDWKTLCTLATYMDGDGFCFPSQSELAHALGCSRQMANERVKSLADFRFQDQPVLLVLKSKRGHAGTWGRNGYRVLSLAGLRIYEPDKPANDSTQTPAATVSRFLDTVSVTDPTVSSQTGTVGLDTNKNVKRKQEFDSSNIRMASRSNLDHDMPDVASGNEPQGVTSLPLEDAIGAWRARRAADGAAPLPPAGSATRVTSPRRRRHEEREYQLIQSLVREVAIEFHDRAPLGATTTRAYNLWRRSGIGIDAFLDHIYAARAIVKERTGSIRTVGADNAAGFRTKHSIGYYFAVLEDVLGLRGTVPAEASDTAGRDPDSTG